MVTFFRNWSPQKTFLLASSATSCIALFLSFVYSRELGANNRGVVGMIFLISLLYSTVALGGLNLTFKSQREPISTDMHLKAFILISLLASLFGSLSTLSLAIVYSNLKSNVPINLLVMGSIYSFFSVALNQFFQILLAKGLTSLKWKLDLFMVLIQTFLYFSLRSTLDISIAVCILLSFTFSYAFLIIFISKFVLKRLIISFEDSERVSTRVKDLMLASKSNVGYAVSIGILDRVDRIIVLIVFPASVYGVYSYLTGIITFARIVPDSISTLIVAKKTFVKIKISTVFQIALTLAISTLFGVVAYLVTEKTFYEGDSLFLWVAIFFCFAELLRATYVSGISHLFQRPGDRTPLKTSLFLLFSFTVLSTIMVQIFGLFGIPFALTLSYLVVLHYLNRREFKLD
jgi:hypothetical protein